jgi:hypothetical protein
MNHITKGQSIKMWLDHCTGNDMHDDMYKLCNAAIQHYIDTAALAQPVSEWLPIESAPKDGTTIDLWHEEFGREADCYWGLPIHSCGEAGSLCDDEFHELNPQWINTFNSPAFPENEYTHWMPPPPAPTGEPG